MYAAIAGGMLRTICWAKKVIVCADDLQPYPDSFMCGLSSDDVVAIRKLSFATCRWLPPRKVPTR